MLDLRVQLVPAALVQQVIPDLRGQPETWGLQVRVQPVMLVLLDRPEILGLQALVQLVMSDPRDRQVRVVLGLQVIPETREILVPLEILDRRGT